MFCDLKNGFFIPNDRKKYSVGENAGFQLNADGGIEIHVSVKKSRTGSRSKTGCRSTGTTSSLTACSAFTRLMSKK